MEFNKEHKDLVRKGKMSAQVACTYLLKCAWSVTTMYRESSAIECPYWYYEIFVWKHDEVTGERKLVRDATEIGHEAACERILKFGEWRDEDQ